MAKTLPLRNYLRVRGEYPLLAPLFSSSGELPPRARRIHAGCAGELNDFGTTSACAENTSRVISWAVEDGNYLRVRGEYPTWPALLTSLAELPPRARRIPVDLAKLFHLYGTTSACAENTMGTVAVTGKPGNYLRVRGEYFDSACWGCPD